MHTPLRALVLGLLSSTSACGALGPSDDNASSGPEDNLTETSSFNLIRGGADLFSWGEHVVVTNGLSLYKHDPLDPAYADEEPLRSVIGTLVLATPSDDEFRDLGLGRSRVSSAASDGTRLYAVASAGSDPKLVRFDTPASAPVDVPTPKVFGVAADADHVFTLEASQARNQFAVVRRDRNGGDAKTMGELPSGRGFYGYISTYVAAKGVFYGMPLGDFDSDGRLRVLDGTSNGSFVEGPSGKNTTLAANTDSVFAATEKGLWIIKAGDRTASMFRSPADLKSDSELAWASCGLLAEYGKGGAIAADDKGVAVVCRDPSQESQVLLEYALDGSLKRRSPLPDAWRPIGQLRLAGNSVCGLEQYKYHQSPQRAQLRCVKRAGGILSWLGF